MGKTKYKSWQATLSVIECILWCRGLPVLPFCGGYEGASRFDLAQYPRFWANDQMFDETLQKAILRAMGPYGDGLWRRRYCCCYGLLAAVRWRGPIAKVRCGRTAVIVMLMIALVVYCSLFWSGRDFRIRLVAHARAPRRPTVCFEPRCMNRSVAVAGFSGAGCARDRACSCSGLVGTSTC